MSLEAFDEPRLAWIIKGGKCLLHRTKNPRRPIAKEILEKITEPEPITVDELNVEIAFKVAWAGSRRLGEITYTGTDLKNASFSQTSVTESDILLAEEDQYAVLRLKRSKTDTEHTGAGIETCPVLALRRLFI